MRIVVIGGTGHVGSYLVPQLVADGHSVINVSRQARSAYFAHEAWSAVTQVNLDRTSIEAYLLKAARDEGFPATVLHPGHIVDRGWAPVNPAGNLDSKVFRQLAKGEPITLPDLGL